MLCSCSALNLRLTDAIQLRNRSGGNSDEPRARRESPLHCHSSASSTNPARNAFATLFEAPVRAKKLFGLRWHRTSSNYECEEKTHWHLIFSYAEERALQ
jgi:hypothetical protein